MKKIFLFIAITISSFCFGQTTPKFANVLSSGRNVDATGTVNTALGVLTADFNNRYLYSAVGAITVKWSARTLNYASTDVSVDWGAAQLKDFAPVLSLDWKDRKLFDTDGTTEVMNWNTQTFSKPYYYSANFGASATARWLTDKRYVDSSIAVIPSLTFSTGLTNTASTITSNLSTGVSGGQSAIGGTAASNNLTLSSTSHGTKGKIIFGSASAFDEAQGFLGIGTASPDYQLHVKGSSYTNLKVESAGTQSYINIKSTSGETFLGCEAGKSFFIYSDTYRMILDRSNNYFAIGSSVGTPTEQISMTGNLSLGNLAGGTSASNTIVLGRVVGGTPPSTSPADVVQLYANDISGGAGTTSLHIRSETGTVHTFGSNVGIATITPLSTLHVSSTYASPLNSGIRIQGTSCGLSFNNGSGRNYAFVNGYNTAGILELLYNPTSGANEPTNTLMCFDAAKAIVSIGLTADIATGYTTTSKFLLNGSAIIGNTALSTSTVSAPANGLLVGGAIKTRGVSANNTGSINPMLYANTTDAATAVELTTDGAGGSGATNRIVVPTDAALSIVLNICVKQTGSANAKQMLRQFVISNNGGTTALQSAVTTLGTDLGSVGLATVTTTITANDTDDCVKIEVNGVVATNLRYTAYVVSSEVIY